MSKSMARCIASISRRTARAFRWSACTPRAPTRRQWRHLLADEEFSKSFRIIAFDMPWHGKSNPPASWDGDGISARRPRATLQTIRAFCKALKLDRPVVMGCSIGGRIVLNLAIEHAAEFRALIGLEAADFQAPWYDTSLAESSRRPRRRGLRRAGIRPDRAAKPGKPRARETLVGLQAGRAGRLQGRSVFLPGRRRSARPGRERSILKYARFICSPASMISPARRKTRNGPLPPSAAPVSRSWSNSVIFR